MKRNVLSGILTLSLVLAASACGTEGGGAASLEARSIESDAAGQEDNASDSASAVVSGAAETGSGTPSSGTETEQNAPSSGAGSGQNAPTSGAGSEPPSGADVSSDVYGSIYLQIINGDEGNTKGYSLIYLDNDDIPELVVLDRGYDSYSIYTVRDGAAFCMIDSMTVVEMTYFEKSGIIAVFSRWNGGGDEGGYGKYYYQVTGDRALTNGEQPILSFSYNAVYDDKGIYTGTGVTDYFHLTQEIHEAAYQEMLESLGIADENDRICMEESYSKEEITVLLSTNL